MTFHLAGGVTREEALVVLSEHGHRWDRCCQTSCGNATPVVSVLLFRGASGEWGDTKGGALCHACDAEITKVLSGTQTYHKVNAEPAVEAADA